MDFYNNHEQEFLRKEQEIRAREAEIRLRELELEIHQQHKQDYADIPHYQTTKHEKSPNALEKLGKKMIKVGKFLGFIIFTIALIKLGVTVGIWLTYGLITLTIIFISYQIFWGDND